MPLTSKGNKIMEAMREQYGEKKGTSVFYASKNAKTITGVDSARDDGQHAYLDSCRRGDAAGMRAHAEAMTRGRH